MVHPLFAAIRQSVGTYLAFWMFHRTCRFLEKSRVDGSIRASAGAQNLEFPLPPFMGGRSKRLERISLLKRFVETVFKAVNLQVVQSVSLAFSSSYFMKPRLPSFS